MLKKLLARLVIVSVGLILSWGPSKAAPRTSPAGETITWEASELRASGPNVIAGGIKTYSPEADIIVKERPKLNGDGVWWSKTLNLDDTFAISAAVYREPILSGFGLTVRMGGEEKGFSWEWFDLADGKVFRKRQGYGQVSVSFINGPGYQELQSVEFLDNIVLRYLDDMSKPPGTHTHEVIIRKGSVLTVAPLDASSKPSEMEPVRSGANGTGNGTLTIGSGVTAPVALVITPPSYTEQARKERIEGFLLLQCIVSRDGKVRDCNIIRGLGYGLDESAMDTVTTGWRFEPGTYQGQPVDVQTHIGVTFKLAK
jgi:TonB family protein